MTQRPGQPRRPERSRPGGEPDDQVDPAVDGGAGSGRAPAELGELGELMGEIARTIQQEHGDVERTLYAITSAARDAIPGADAVSVSFVTGRQVRSRAATNDLPQTIDDLQSRLDQGPCLDALRDAKTVRVDDYANDDRWPRFTEEASRAGAGSSLSFQLFVDGDNMGALNVYSSRPHAFTEESETVGLVFASHASIALSSAQQEENLRRAMDHRDLIGQAKGILMERHRLTAAQAFQVLVQASSSTNRKLFDIAEELTTTGTMPGR